MFFAHEDIVFALSQDLDKPDQWQAVWQRLVADRPDCPCKRALGPDYPQILKAFLTEDIPPLEEAQKIVPRLVSMAQAHGITIGEFAWWEIVPKLRSLRAKLERPYEGRLIGLTTYFFWKKTDKQALLLHNEMSKTSLHPDPETPEKFRIQFEATSYQVMRDRFETWLAAPLLLPRDR